MPLFGGFVMAYMDVKCISSLLHQKRINLGKGTNMKDEKELTAKEEAFCVAYTTIGSETFNNGTQSAIEAGYAENSARTQAWRMLRKEHIKKRIRELYDKNMEENMVTVSSVLANLAHDRQMARKQHQYSVAKSCTELEGKYLAMFTDNINQKQSPEPKPMTEQERKAAKAAARAYNEEMSKTYPRLSDKRIS